MNKLLFLLIGLCFMPSIGFSQSEEFKQNKIVFGMGYSHLRFHDIQSSPLIYKDHSLPLNIGYEARRNKSIFSSELKMSFGYAQSKRQGSRTTNSVYYDNDNNEQELEVKLQYPNMRVDLSVEYLFLIGNYKDNNIKWYAGGQLREFFMLQYLSTWGMGMGFFLNELFLNPSTLVDYQVSKNTKLSSSLSVSGLGFISRLPYSNTPMTVENGPIVGAFKQGTKFTTIDEYQRFDFGMGYEKQLNEKWDIRFDYNFYWLRYNEVEPIRAYNNSFTIKFARKLG